MYKNATYVIKIDEKNFEYSNNDELRKAKNDFLLMHIKNETFFEKDLQKRQI